MADKNEGFVMPSKQEIDNAPAKFTPLRAEDYILRLSKVSFVQAPTYLNGAYNGPLAWKFEVICTVVGLKAGGAMLDKEGQEVSAFQRHLFKDVNPYSVGFQPDGAPSILRGLVSHLEGKDTNEKLSPPNFILLKNDDDSVVEDANLREQYLTNMRDGKLLDGYKAVPDIRPYEGRYIAANVITSSPKNNPNKIQNKISDFRPMPSTFTKPDAEAEAKAKESFEEYHKNLLEGRKQREANTPQATPEVEAMEIESDEVPI